MNMFDSIGILIVVMLTLVRPILSENLNGIYVIATCECSSPTEKCEPNGPFILDQQRSSFAVRYGAIQVGVGTAGNNRLDLFLNQNRCKGIWNGKGRMAELKCQHQGGIVCSTKLRCVSGACLDDTSTIVSSATTTMITYMTVLSMIGSLFMFIH